MSSAIFSAKVFGSIPYRFDGDEAADGAAVFRGNAEQPRHDPEGVLRGWVAAALYGGHDSLIKGPGLPYDPKWSKLHRFDGDEAADGAAVLRGNAEELRDDPEGVLRRS